MRGINGVHKKPPARVQVEPSSKILVSREEAAQLLSLSVRGIDYLLATRRLPFRKIGGRVLIPVSELRKYAQGDHPERIVA
jgi:excisionase family DNA binding protein